MTLQTATYSNFYESTLDGAVGQSDTSFTLSAAPTSDGTSAIAAPFYLVLDPDSASNREVVLVTASSGVTMSTVTRDVEGRHATDPSHSDGTTVRMAVVGEMFEDLHDRLNDVALTGDVTGTINSSTQDIATTISALDATKIADGSVTSTEFQYINTLSSNAQTQLDAKLALSGGTLSGNVAFGDNEASGVVLKDYAETNQSSLTSSSGTLSIDLANGNTGQITLTENVTTVAFTNVPTSGISSFTLVVTQDASTAYDITTSGTAITINGGAGGAGKTVGGAGVTISTTLSGIDIVTFLFVGANYPYINALQDFS